MHYAATTRARYADRNTVLTALTFYERQIEGGDFVYFDVFMQILLRNAGRYPREVGTFRRRFEECALPVIRHV